MGCVGPKSLISVRDDATFLDLNVQQIEVRLYYIILLRTTEVQCVGFVQDAGELLVQCVLKSFVPGIELYTWCSDQSTCVELI